MKISKTSIFVELPETLEEGSAKTMCEKPYYIERVEHNKEIIWFGYNTNWKCNMTTGKWYQLIGQGFVECYEPHYEKLFQKLKK